MSVRDPNNDERLLANSFTTGHRPKLSYFEFLAQVNANCHIMSSSHDGPKHPKARKSKHKEAKRSRVRRFLDKAETLAPDELALLQALIESKCVVVYCHGIPYAAKRIDNTQYVVRGLEHNSHEYVCDTGTNSCSCPDSRMRQHECKHLKALRSIA